MIPISASDFAFEPDAESREYLRLIVESMMRSFGITPAECVDRINQRWSHIPAVKGESDEIYRERSRNDPSYFMEPPFIVSSGRSYELCWQYGKMGFYFIPSHRVRDGRLLFSLQGTSSTGSVPGRYGSMPISSADEAHALETAGAFWVEPDGQEEKLEVREAGACVAPPAGAAQRPE